MKKIDPDDPNLFDPDKEHKEPTKGEIILRYIRIVVALVVIVGLLYISGVYQLFLYQRTPDSVTQKEVENRLDAELVALPLRVFVFVNDESGSKRSEEDVRRLVENTSKIWEQAGIELDIEEIIFLELSDEEINAFLHDPGAFVANIHDYHDQRINVFLKETLMGLNGIAFVGLGVVTVADLTTSYDFRVLAHEVGHVFGLGHVPGDEGRLMSQGADGFNLTPEEIMQARQAVLNFMRIQNN